jgi:hypothetical protein
LQTTGIIQESNEYIKRKRRAVAQLQILLWSLLPNVAHLYTQTSLPNNDPVDFEEDHFYTAFGSWGAIVLVTCQIYPLHHYVKQQWQDAQPIQRSLPPGADDLGWRLVQAKEKDYQNLLWVSDRTAKWGQAFGGDPSQARTDVVPSAQRGQELVRLQEANRPDSRQQKSQVWEN